jgi:septal ring factor EnvC (AmiA/AmiB activator)
MLEARVNLGIIALLEDKNGCTQPIDRQEIVKERILSSEFDPPLEQEKNTEFIIQVQDLKWDGDTQENELIISYSLSYMIYAVREQVVPLYGDEQETLNRRELANDLPNLESEIERIRDDNERLTRQLCIYERDLMSLKRGIKKAETRNVVLSSELNGARELVEKLRDAITRKDILICHYQNPQNENRKRISPLLSIVDEEFKLGRKIKRMLMNSL